ncbi:MAG: cell division protein, partial [Xanthomonadales bacterium]|nr:cell division protein [Xanthomonadales bacterium]
IAMWFLHSPVETLALSYGSSLTLAGLSITQGLALIGCGMLLGWGGAWLASAQRLRAIDPR